MAAIDLTPQEIERVVALVVAQQIYGVVTPEDKTIVTKLNRQNTNLAPLSQEDIVRHYTDPTARK